MGSADQAVAAYSDAIAKDPLNPRLRLEYATALRKAKSSSSQIIAALRDALHLESQRPNPDVRRSIYEFLTYLLLYEPKPQGFTETIRYGTSYTADSTSLPSVSIWINLAAAYGQKAHWIEQHAKAPDQMQDAQTPKDAFKKARDEAFHAAEQAIQLQLDPDAKEFLASLMEPTDPNEDDLQVFADDNKFRELLGLPKRPSS